MARKKRVLFVFPTAWDHAQLRGCQARWEAQFEVVYAEPSDWDCPWDLDIVDWIARTSATYDGTIDGVTSSSDYPGATVAGAIATNLGLPGPLPQSVLRCSHKYHSRLSQRESVPEATPAFGVIDPDDVTQPPSTGLPCFVKPVKGAFSIMSGMLREADEYRAFFSRPVLHEFRHQFLFIFNQLVAHFTDFPTDGRSFLAEAPLSGNQVTVEGYARGDDIVVLGITDSVLHPETKSFERFVFPSDSRSAAQVRMRDIAIRCIRGLDLRNSFFNIELIHDPQRDTIHIIEVNPRMCGQFGDLYEKVLGVNSYELLLALATGAPMPVVEAARDDVVAASVPLRVYVPVRVAAAPDAAALRAAESLFPGTRVWNECHADQRLDNFENIEDGKSFRYAVVNLGAPDRETLSRRLVAIEAKLGYRFEALVPGP